MLDDRAVAAAVHFARANLHRSVRELCDFIRIPSVSGDPHRLPDVRRAADWLSRALGRVGISNARLIETSGSPIVTGTHVASRGPPLIVYGHYDVQPPGNLAAWRTPPFSPVIKHGAIYGRGASDDKGQLFAHVKAIEAWMRTRGELPTQLTCIFEGEEEIGSPSLRGWLASHGNTLRARAAIISDTRMRAEHEPAITHALRGKMRIELVVVRRGSDVHAGDFAGVVLDPARELTRLVASLHDAQSRPRVRGFHDRVRPLTSHERDYMRRVGARDDELIAAARGEPLLHDASRTLYEITTTQPSLSVTELTSGDVDAKRSAIPTTARAMFDVRLVPDQDPAFVARCLEQHFKRIASPGAHVALRVLSSSRAVHIDPRQPALQAAARAAFHTFGRPAVFLRSGGTIPVATEFHARGITPVLMGFALSDDGMHAPNEHFAIDRFAQAIECSIRFFAESARALATSRPRAPATSRMLLRTGIHV